MKIQIDRRLTAAWTSSVLLSLSAACNGELAVVDDIEDNGAGLSSYRSEGPLNASCACASSDSLMALSCGGGVVPYRHNDVQTTADGGVVAFNLCDDNLLECRVIYWDGSFAQLPIASGILLGLSASGDQMLSSGSGSGVQLIDPNGTSALPLTWTVGSGMLSASGDRVVGPTDVGDDGSAQLVRVDTATGEREVLGELGGPLSRAYMSPNATASVGQGYSNVEDRFFSYFWTEQRGLTFGLPGIPEGVAITPDALSDDGSVIAGYTMPGGLAFRWTEADGYAELPLLSGYGEQSLLSSDGSVLFSTLDPEGANRTSAYRWTDATGAVELAPGIETIAAAMSDDGSVVVAMSWEDAQIEGASPEQTFVWNAVDGTRSLDEILASRGADTTGWEFDQVRALSGNGKVMLGRATCGGVPTLYRVVLSD